MKLYRMSSDNKHFLFLDRQEMVCKVYKLLDAEAVQEGKLGLMGGLFGGASKNKQANYVFRQ